jgi:hypothetical protein
LPETHPYVASLIDKARDENANFLYHAPIFIIVSNLKDNGNAMPDSALAIGNMMDIPENHVVYGSVVMGYPADEPKPTHPHSYT